MDGEPAYVDDDYVENDYQAHDGHVVVLSAGDVGYSVPVDAVNDDGLDLLSGLRASDVISDFEVVNGAPAQVAAVAAGLAISPVAKDAAESVMAIL